jgi:hypothetical protein
VAVAAVAHHKAARVPVLHLMAAALVQKPLQQQVQTVLLTQAAAQVAVLQQAAQVAQVL